MLLTSSQVSFLISTGIIVTFTLALFLAGYVLQQQTVRSLTAEIKPRMHARAKGYSQLHGLSLPTQFATAEATPTVIPEELAAAPSPVISQIETLNLGESPEIVYTTNQEVTNEKQDWNGQNGMKEQQVVVGSEEKWRSRLHSDDDEYLIKGQEQFDMEGDDFFAPGKTVVGQMGYGGRRR